MYAYIITGMGLCVNYMEQEPYSVVQHIMLSILIMILLMFK